MPTSIATPLQMASEAPTPVYFAGSIRGGREDAALYAEIIGAMRGKGLDVLTEHVGAAFDADPGNRAGG